MFISTVLRAEEIIWAKQPKRGLPGIFFFTSEKVADYSSHSCILQRGWLNSAKTEKYSLLCLSWWEKQTGSCAFAWSRLWACQEAMLASIRICQHSVIAFFPLPYLWGISFLPLPASVFFPSFTSLYLLFFLLLHGFTAPFLPLASGKFPLKLRAACLCSCKWQRQVCHPAACPASCTVASLCTTALGWVTCRKGEGVPSCGYSPCAAIFHSQAMPRRLLINSSGCR